jgi:hypothetical protein
MVDAGFRCTLVRRVGFRMIDWRKQTKGLHDMMCATRAIRGGL